MSDGYETEELVRIEAALDALVSPTSEDVFQATRPFDERAIASVAATRGGNSGSMPAEWTVDPVTGALLITISQVDVSGLIVDNFDINYDFTDDGIVISGKNGASGSVEVDDGSGHFGQLDGGGGLLIRNDPTDNWSIRVVDMSNAPVFGVARDGTVHIKTGTVIVADL